LTAPACRRHGDVQTHDRRTTLGARRRRRHMARSYFCQGLLRVARRPQHARASRERAWPCSESAGEAGTAFSRPAAVRAPPAAAAPPAAGAHSRGRNVHSAARRSSASAAAAARPARAGASEASSASGRGACIQAMAVRMQRHAGLSALMRARPAGRKGPPKARAGRAPGGPAAASARRAAAGSRTGHSRPRRRPRARPARAPRPASPGARPPPPASPRRGPSPPTCRACPAQMCSRRRPATLIRIKIMRLLRCCGVQLCC